MGKLIHSEWLIHGGALYSLPAVRAYGGVDVIDRMDNLDYIRRIDSRGMMNRVLGLPDTLEEAVQSVSESSLGAAGIGEGISSVVVAGLGASALAADMVYALGSKSLSVPFIVSRGYNLPAFVGPGTLVVCVSYSGNTDEVLSTYHEAREKGARVAAVTSGGRLALLAGNDGGEMARVPGGRFSRDSLGPVFIVLATLFERLGIVARVLDDLPGAVRLLSESRGEWEPDIPSDENEAKMLAIELHERIPVLYGSPGVTGVAAYRWKSMLNENAKVHAFCNVFPELNSNEILGWELANLQSESFAAVFMHSPEDLTRVSDRLHITSTLIPRGFMTKQVDLKGENDLERLLWGIYLGDVVSVYLAILYGIDPVKTTGIDRLKEELARGRA